MVVGWVPFFIEPVECCGISISVEFREMVPWFEVDLFCSLAACFLLQFVFYGISYVVLVQWLLPWLPMSDLFTVELLILFKVADVLLLICRCVLFVLLLSIFVANCSHHLGAVTWSHAILFESLFRIVLRQVIDQCLDLQMLMCLDCNIRVLSSLFSFLQELFNGWNSFFWYAVRLWIR